MVPLLKEGLKARPTETTFSCQDNVMTHWPCAPLSRVGNMQELVKPRTLLLAVINYLPLRGTKAKEEYHG